MKAADFISGPCGCPECRQAGVDAVERRRDPRSGEWLHGFALRRWLDARNKFMAEAREAVGAKGRHANGFEPLVKKP